MGHAWLTLCSLHKPEDLQVVSCIPLEPLRNTRSINKGFRIQTHRDHNALASRHCIFEFRCSIQLILGGFPKQVRLAILGRMTFWDAQSAPLEFAMPASRQSISQRRGRATGFCGTRIAIWVRNTMAKMEILSASSNWNVHTQRCFDTRIMKLERTTIYDENIKRYHKTNKKHYWSDMRFPWHRMSDTHYIHCENSFQVYKTTTMRTKFTLHIRSLWYTYTYYCLLHQLTIYDHDCHSWLVHYCMVFIMTHSELNLVCGMWGNNRPFQDLQWPLCLYN